MSKPKWNCESIKFIKTEITSSDLQQRLAEVLQLLLNSKSQLNSTIAISNMNTRETAPLSKTKQRSA